MLYEIPKKKWFLVFNYKGICQAAIGTQKQILHFQHEIINIFIKLI